MANEIYRFITYIKVQPELENEMKQALSKLVEANLSDPSCVHCAAYQVIHKTHNFLLSEHWKSIEDYRNHIEKVKNCSIRSRIVHDLSALMDTQELILLSGTA